MTTTPDDTPADKRAALLETLRSYHGTDIDQEGAHVRADEALLEYIDDPEITEAFEAIEKWYA